MNNAPLENWNEPHPDEYMRYYLWMGHEAYDFEESRAILINIYWTKAEAQQYIKNHPRPNGHYWIDEKDIS